MPCPNLEHSRRSDTSKEISRFVAGKKDRITERTPLQDRCRPAGTRDRGVRRVMTEHTRRQKGRNVARLIRDESPRVSPERSAREWGALAAGPRPLSTKGIRDPGSLKNKPACGPRVYLRCSTSRAKHYASVLLRVHPTAPRRCTQGIVASSGVCLHVVGTRAGFVTRSLYPLLLLHASRCNCWLRSLGSMEFEWQRFRYAGFDCEALIWKITIRGWS